MNVVLITRDTEWWHRVALRFYTLTCIGHREFTAHANRAYSIRNALQNETTERT